MMTRSPAASQLGREFDAFLFAPVGEERNGMTLSVVSALARSNVDPWQEAAELAQLPRKTAVQRLASIISALRAGSSTLADSGTAARLIGLLPRSDIPAVASHERPLAGASAVLNTKSMVAYAILLALFISAETLMAGHQPPPVDNSHATTSGAISPHVVAPPVSR